MVPQGHENVTTLIEFFKSKGLNELDLVILSACHTIGRSSCYSILHRLAKPDPTLDIQYWKQLRKKCRRGWDLVDLDVTTPKTFDIAYFTNLQKKLGLLSTDSALYTNQMTAAFVDATVSQPSLFESQFAASMVKLGNVQVLTRKNEGEIRLNCNSVNRNY
ncbi:Plant peroxidase [Corchorus capsularis]|uniref:peroxidase n=1 Tax=Corchorus capsularis TaxID=210143 RepID=A0A1R3HF51_COCAP|nr:Plant peroxidase [Corchorus capsularis]